MFKFIKMMLTKLFLGPDEGTMIEDVRQFHVKFDLIASLFPVHLTQAKLKERIDFMQEELDEFKVAAKSQDLAEQADALVDLVYVAMGTAVMLGLPWDELWAEVQRANMDKVRGMTKRGHAVDVTKLPGWIPPQINDILYAHYYDPEDWGHQGRVWDEYCVDDNQRYNGMGYSR